MNPSPADAEVTQTSHRQGLDEGPVVRAGGLCLVSEGLLLVEQRRGEEAYLLLPGGGVRFGETLADSLRREFIEELHLPVTVGRPLAFLEAISPDMIAYRKHVLHVVLEVHRANGANGARLAPHDGAVVAARFVPRAELSGLDLRPPIADFLDGCFDRVPETPVYLGRRW